jgi:flagellin
MIDGESTAFRRVDRLRVTIMSSDIVLSAGVRQNLLALQNTANLLAITQNRLATGKKVNSALDNPTNFFTSSALSARANDLSSILDSLSNGISTLQAANNGLTAITNTVNTLQATVSQARQDSSFQTTSYSIDANTIGIATTKYLTLSGGSIGATGVNVALQSNTGGITNPATAATYAGGALTPLNFTTVAATAGSVAFNNISGTPIDFTGAAATSAVLTGSSAANGSAGTYKGTGIDLSGNANDTFSFDVNGTTITLHNSDGTAGVVSEAQAVTAINTQLTAASSTVSVAAGSGANAGKLVFTNSATGYANQVAITNIATGGTANTAAITDLGFVSGDTAHGLDAVAPSISFQVAIDGGSANTVTINKAAVQSVGNHDAKIDTLAELQSLIQAQLGSNVTVGTSGSHITLTSNTSGGSSSVQVSNYALNGVTAHPAVAFSDTTGVLQSNTTGNGTAAVNPTLTFNVAVDGGNTQTVTINQATVQAVGNHDSSIDTGVELAAIISQQLGPGVTVAANLAGGVTFTSGTTGSSSEVHITGLTATGVANTSGLANTDVFGTPVTFTGGTNAVDTVDQLVTAINSNAALIGKVKANNNNGQLSIQNLSTLALNVVGIGANGIDGSAGTGTIAGNSVRGSLITQFNQLKSQIDSIAADASYNGINLLQGDVLKLVFNETDTSSLNIRSLDPNGINSSVLGISTGNDTQFSSNSQLDALSTTLSNALTQLRSQASAFGSNLSIVQNRQDFTKNLINTLTTGSDNLVLADTNEEGANLLALQTRQSLSTTALSLANQANQSVLRLFG